jgi:uncharacterized alpha-E superfamily protein
MISRVAESCFWLQRYIERAESTARLLAVNRFTVLDAAIQGAERWRPVIVVVGEEERFLELCGADAYDDDDVTERYLAWEEQNPISIASSIYWARENARTIREVISPEMWETLNTFFQWLNGPAGEREFREDRANFYQKVRDMTAQFQGACHSTMLHEEPFDFMNLGLVLERVNQTARVMDVMHHWLSAAPPEPGVVSALEAAQWAALLRFCCATEPFFKRASTAPTGPRVAEFLLKDEAFPRSALHCLDRARYFLERIQRRIGRPRPPAAYELILPLSESLRERPMVQIFAEGLHEELTRIIETTAQACGLIANEYFNPGPVKAPELPSSPRASAAPP